MRNSGSNTSAAPEFPIPGRVPVPGSIPQELGIEKGKPDSLSEIEPLLEERSELLEDNRFSAPMAGISSIFALYGSAFLASSIGSATMTEAVYGGSLLAGGAVGLTVASRDISSNNSRREEIAEELDDWHFKEDYELSRWFNPSELSLYDGPVLDEAVYFDFRDDFQKSLDRYQDTGLGLEDVSEAGAGVQNTEVFYNELIDELEDEEIEFYQLIRVQDMEDASQERDNASQGIDWQIYSGREPLARILGICYDREAIPSSVNGIWDEGDDYIRENSGLDF